MMVLKNLEQFPWLPGGGQRVVDFSPSQKVHDGMVGEERVQGRGKKEGGKECGASGWPRVQFSWTLVKPALVVRFREASPPWVQTEINSVRDAYKNWELVLAAMLPGIITTGCS